MKVCCESVRRLSANEFGRRIDCDSWRTGIGKAIQWTSWEWPTLQDASIVLGSVAARDQSWWRVETTALSDPQPGREYYTKAAGPSMGGATVSSDVGGLGVTSGEADFFPCEPRDVHEARVHCVREVRTSGGVA